MRILFLFFGRAKRVSSFPTAPHLTIFDYPALQRRVGVISLPKWPDMMPRSHSACSVAKALQMGCTQKKAARPGPTRTGHSLSQPIGARSQNMRSPLAVSLPPERALGGSEPSKRRPNCRRVCTCPVSVTDNCVNQGGIVPRLDALKAPLTLSDACDTAKRPDPTFPPPVADLSRREPGQKV